MWKTVRSGKCATGREEGARVHKAGNGSPRRGPAAIDTGRERLRGQLGGEQGEKCDRQTEADQKRHDVAAGILQVKGETTEAIVLVVRRLLGMRAM